MTQVTKQEIVEALWGFETYFYRADGKRIESWSLAKRILRYGIAPEPNNIGRFLRKGGAK